MANVQACLPLAVADAPMMLLLLLRYCGAATHGDDSACASQQLQQQPAEHLIVTSLGVLLVMPKPAERCH